MCKACVAVVSAMAGRRWHGPVRARSEPVGGGCPVEGSRSWRDAAAAGWMRTGQRQHWPRRRFLPLTGAGGAGLRDSRRRGVCAGLVLVTCCGGSARVALQALFGFDFGLVLGLIWAQRVEARVLCSTEGDQRSTMPGHSPPISGG
jgi:hypothetical protein